ncbi:restriction endonuclease subunit S [Escherichia coli]|uniref:restriction endonuclease subunit S n=1 Tax=Escherichia coli TaxID=562 RepID=UPI001C2890EA|nr:restriction endonuclease subunit S [Escherichia coli]MDW9263174.1 restriction endonuclease subunit S [Escherichia coli]HAW6886934.1 restriction endonuclease subunit S [Escherichia coli]HBH5070194.1 restriction endonuclease subunit S [Escherichia coli]HBM8957548.1 restriction endonuclease subunit S [Escherichia coli]
MGSKWVHAKLGDYIDSNLGKMLDQNKNKGDFHPYLGNSNVRWGYFDLENLSLMKFEEHESDRYGIRKGDLIICEGGEPGRCAIWEDDVPNMKIQKALHRVRPLPGLTSEYLYYWFLYFGRTGQLDAYFTGTTIKHLTGKALSELPIEIPPIDEQKHISMVLGSLDTKIKANRKINKTLEQMSQTLFKSWFVDFDPVIDNALDAGNPIPEALQSRAELRQKVRNSADFKPLPAEIRSLFPSEFEETELGWVPKGWHYKNAEEIATISIGKTPPRTQKECFCDKKDSNYAWVSIKDLGNCSVFIKDSSEYLTSDAVNSYNVKIVPKDAVLLSFKLTIGRIAIAEDILTTNEAIAHFYNMKHGINKEYLYSYLKIFDYNSLGSTSSIATAINSKIIRKIPVLVPDGYILEKYKKSTDIIFQKIKFNNGNICNLTALRDTLLPKLISGELSLDDLPDLTTDTEAA